MPIQTALPNNMTDPLLYACLEGLREKLLITRNEAGVTVVEKAIEEIERLDVDLACANEEINRLNKELELYKQIANNQNKNWEITPKLSRTLEYGDDLL